MDVVVAADAADVGVVADAVVAAAVGGVGEDHTRSWMSLSSNLWVALEVVVWCMRRPLRQHLKA